MKFLRLILTGFVALVFIGGANAPGQNADTVAPKIASGRLVRLNLIVTDQANHSRDDIRQEDIQVFEGGTQQTIVLFEKDERPIDYILAVDTSESLRPIFGALLEVVRLIIENKRASDEIFIERFISGDKIETLQDFTADKELLRSALKKMRPEGGQSAVIDGTYLAIEHIAKRAQPERRKAVVLITDGEDRSSFYTIEKLVKLLHKTNVQVFIVGLVTELDQDGGRIRLSNRQLAEKLLTTIAKESRGRLFLPTTIGDLDKATAEIAHDLQRQYVVGYRSTNSDGNPGFRKVEVKIVTDPKTEKLKVIAPRGYEVVAPRAN
ncbi:MAG TPA: VWA domain-containing protein [Pyrinomonadaceae bacterium]|nr:VWA domain-containing protein [Pyrinomonadaceae bacterium]